MTGTNTVLYGQKTNYEKDHLDKCTIFYSGNKFCLITTAKNTYVHIIQMLEVSKLLNFFSKWNDL